MQLLIPARDELFFFFLSWIWNSYDLKIGEKKILKIGIWVEFSV